jgi:hypothetical protein
VRVSSRTDAPATIGVLRPIVLLPPATLLGVTPQQLEALLAHELAHVRRHDYLVNVLQIVSETLFFHHPAVWWVSRRIRVERELCCDDIAVQACGDPISYAHALSKVGRQSVARPRLAVGSADGPLLRRIQRLLGVTTTAPPVSPGWLIVASTAIVPLLLAGAGAQATRPGTVAQSATEDEGTLRGRVVDAGSGNPVAGAHVRAQYITGVERPTKCPIGDCEDVVAPGVGRIPVYRATTDTDGRFEIPGMRPGEYLVASVAKGYVQRYFGQTTGNLPEVPVQVRSGARTDAVQIRLEASGSIAGRILSDTGEGLSSVEVELLRRTYRRGGAQAVAVAFAQTETRGAFSFDNVAPGEYYLRAYVPASIRPTRGDGSLAYVTTFLPGVAERALAHTVVVGGGANLLGMDFALTTARRRVVSGRLIDPAGVSPATATVLLFPIPSGPTDTLRTSVAPDGAFHFGGVTQGDYMLLVNDTAVGRSWNTAVRDISVFQDVTDLQFVAGPSVSIAGHVTAENDRPITFDLSELRIFAEQRFSELGSHGVGFARVAVDGTFSMTSGTGTMSLRIVGLPGRWSIKAARLDGVDVTDVPFELGPGTRRRLDIEVTDRVGRLSGVVTDRTGRPLPNALVVIFPADRAKWGNADLIRTTFSYDQGLYEVADLPIADYRVVAVTTLPQNAWTDPDVLARLWPSGTAVWLDALGQRTVTLEAVRPPADLLP